MSGTEKGPGVGGADNDVTLKGAAPGKNEAPTDPYMEAPNLAELGIHTMPAPTAGTAATAQMKAATMPTAKMTAASSATAPLTAAPARVPGPGPSAQLPESATLIVGRRHSSRRAVHPVAAREDHLLESSVEEIIARHAAPAGGLPATQQLGELAESLEGDIRELWVKVVNVDSDGKPLPKGGKRVVIYDRGVAAETWQPIWPNLVARRRHRNYFRIDDDEFWIDTRMVNWGADREQKLNFNRSRRRPVGRKIGFIAASVAAVTLGVVGMRMILGSNQADSPGGQTTTTTPLVAPPTPPSSGGTVPQPPTPPPPAPVKAVAQCGVRSATDARGWYLEFVDCTGPSEGNAQAPVSLDLKTCPPDQEKVNGTCVLVRNAAGRVIGHLGGDLFIKFNPGSKSFSIEQTGNDKARHGELLVHLDTAVR